MKDSETSIEQKGKTVYYEANMIHQENTEIC